MEKVNPTFTSVQCEDIGQRFGLKVDKAAKINFLLNNPKQGHSKAKLMIVSSPQNCSQSQLTTC